MIQKIKCILIIVGAPLIVACSTSGGESEKLGLFTKYFDAVKSKSEDKWEYTADTVRVWFDDTLSEPTLNIKGEKPNDAWKQWDEVMNTTVSSDSIWYDPQENAVKGYFYENNDFYTLIGKGPTKTLRTYWFNQSNKIDRILLYWIPEENTTTSTHLAPIVSWALQNDSLEISRLYPGGRIVPSRENALRWKALLEKYRTRSSAE